MGDWTWAAEPRGWQVSYAPAVAAATYSPRQQCASRALVQVRPIALPEPRALSRALVVVRPARRVRRVGAWSAPLRPVSTRGDREGAAANLVQIESQARVGRNVGEPVAQQAAGDDGVDSDSEAHLGEGKWEGRGEVGGERGGEADLGATRRLEARSASVTRRGGGGGGGGGGEEMKVGGVVGEVRWRLVGR